MTCVHTSRKNLITKDLQYCNNDDACGGLRLPICYFGVPICYFGVPICYFGVPICYFGVPIC
ncbi:hypothetical protein, partial [Nostoc sp.]|uniref:hypothetical protein n=1 Tax=Nostoc sp. TaxID=1180 RepID=UPI002FFB9CE4